MANRPTIADLAREAGVSVATVDRVLNRRAKVRDETARKVYDAARQIGYHAAALIGQRMHDDLPHFRLGLVLNKERQSFYRAFREISETVVPRTPGVRAEVVVRFCSSQSPASFVAEMEALRGEVDAIAATAVAHVELTDSVERIQASGIPCFSLLNDFAQGARRSYIGLNNVKAGRVAGHMLATCLRRPGKVAVFVGGHRWHGHELRETGFRSYLRENAPGVTVLDTLVNLETRRLTYEATLDLLARHPDLAGLYCAGGGMEGAIAALREVRTPDKVPLIVHELTPESRMGLADRYVAMVIATPLELVVEKLMSLAVQSARTEPTALPGQLFLRPDLYLPESI